MKYIFIIFCISCLVQAIFYLFVFSKFAFKKQQKQDLDRAIPVSIVICGKNEANNFKTFLPEILSQNHETFEVVVIDDHSTDNTKEILEALAAQYANLKLITPNKVPDKPGKKAALDKGIQNATHPNIIVTDADCYPASKDWASLMVQPLTANADLVLGFSPYDEHGSILNAVVQFETYLTALQYGGFAAAGIPFMGVGRNMAYKKSFFVPPQAGELASGDDDLLVNKQASAKTTQLVFVKDSLTFSAPPENWKTWFKQKLRHYTAGAYYKPMHIILLNLFAITMICSNLLLFVLLFSPFWKLPLLVFVLLLVIKNSVHAKGLPKMLSSNLAISTMFLEILWSVLLPILTIASQFKNKKKWS